MHASLRQITLCLAVAGIAVPTFAQPKPPTLEQNFSTPPNAARPWVYWFVMGGNWTREGITADLEAMKAAGIGGVIYMEVTWGIPEGPVKFMSPEWQRLWAHAVHEAERLGLAVTLNGGPGWTGSGGPWIKPEDSMQNVSTATLEVTGPKAFNEALPQPPRRTNFTDYYRDIKVLAFPSPEGNRRIADVNQKSFFERSGYSFLDNVRLYIPSYSEYDKLPSNQVIDTNKVLDITDKLGPDGKLNWQVPAGKWTIVRLGAVNNGALTRPAPQPGIGLESDKMSTAALETHYRDFIQPLLKAVGPRKVSADSGWNGLHIDSWEVGSQNWSPNFLNEFKKRRGYDATSYMAVLNGLVVGSIEQSERFLYDWRQTCHDLIVQNHVTHFREIGHKDKFKLSTEAYFDINTSDASMGSVADVPMGEFWTVSGPDGSGMDITLGAAAAQAHTTGKSIVGAEAFTADDREAWQMFPASMKVLGDWAFTEGINRFVIHRYQHQPTLNQFPGMTMGPWGVHWERTQSWWSLVPEYHRYLARAQYMLRQGKPVSDICYLVPEGAPFVFRSPIAAERTKKGDQPGYRFDACAPEVFISRMSVKNGALTLPDGVSYRVLVLPERDTMTPSMLEKVAQLVRDGATVIGPRPVKSPSLAGYPQSDEAVRQLADEVWGDCDGDTVTQHTYGKGRVIWKKSSQDLSQAAASAFKNAEWIWFNEGNPAASAPIGKRHFQRTFSIDNVAQLKSATWTLTADNSFETSLNGQAVGSGDDWHHPWSFDVKSKLKSGENSLTIIADNGSSAPNPAGVIGTLKLTYNDGRVVEIATDKTWQSAQNASGPWSAALSLGVSNIGPWNLESASTPAAYGDFSIVKGVLQSMKLSEDFKSDGPIRFIHRRDGQSDIFFLANYTDQPVKANNTFRVGAKVPELWNPLTGERRALTQYTVKDEGVTVPLQFDATQSWFVVFRPGKIYGKGAPNFAPVKKIGELTGAWQVSFDPKWRGPSSITFPKLIDWTKHSDEGVRFYSGKAVYRKSFNATASGQKTYLDLGIVHDMASVKVNGKSAGTVWCAPWRVEVSKQLKPGNNQVEITVANRWPNRLIGDKSLPPGMQVTNTTWNPYQPTSQLLPSGLIGPVSVWREMQ